MQMVTRLIFHRGEQPLECPIQPAIINQNLLFKKRGQPQRRVINLFLTGASIQRQTSSH